MRVPPLPAGIPGAEMYATIPSSSMAERAAVNRLVGGSSPSLGAMKVLMTLESKEGGGFIG